MLQHLDAARAARQAQQRGAAARPPVYIDDLGGARAAARENIDRLLQVPAYGQAAEDAMARFRAQARPGQQEDPVWAAQAMHARDRLVIAMDVERAMLTVPAAQFEAVQELARQARANFNALAAQLAGNDANQGGPAQPR